MTETLQLTTLTQYEKYLQLIPWIYSTFYQYIILLICTARCEQ